MGKWRAAAASMLAVLMLGGAAAPGAAAGPPEPYEVWLVDQSDSAGRSHGGNIHVYAGDDVTRDLSQAEPVHVVDLGGATSSLCAASTGALPVRPHMIVFNRAETRAALSFVASGHVVVFDAATRKPLACLRTEAGAGGARQAHALWPTEDDAHGTAVSVRERHVWVGDRDGNVAEVFDGVTGAHEGTVGLVSPFSADPTVDLFASSPDQKWIFASTRGPHPLSGDPHSSHGSDPGMLVIRVTADGKSGQVRGLIRVSNPDAAGLERADPHGIRTRRVPATG
ncbi:hypothetical protein [Planomonospora algeriensis]